MLMTNLGPRCRVVAYRKRRRRATKEGVPVGEEPGQVRLIDTRPDLSQSKSDSRIQRDESIVFTARPRSSAFDLNFRSERRRVSSDRSSDSDRI